jgi:predicted Abi (CAAX) family protease
MAMLDVDTSITFLQTLADDRYNVHDDYARIVMYCNDLQGQYRPVNTDEAPWKTVRDKIASMDLQNGYNDMDLVIDAMVRDMNDNQLALLRTLAFGERTASYVKGAIDMYNHLGWKS